jgi:hypothetical protein
MKALRAIPRPAEEVSGKSVQLMRDGSLPLFAALTMARRGAAYHVDVAPAMQRAAP